MLLAFNHNFELNVPFIGLLFLLIGFEEFSFATLLRVTYASQFRAIQALNQRNLSTVNSALLIHMKINIECTGPMCAVQLVHFLSGYPYD